MRITVHANQRLAERFGGFTAAEIAEIKMKADEDYTFCGNTREGHDIREISIRGSLIRLVVNPEDSGTIVTALAEYDPSKKIPDDNTKAIKFISDLFTKRLDELEKKITQNTSEIEELKKNGIRVKKTPLKKMEDRTSFCCYIKYKASSYVVTIPKALREKAGIKANDTIGYKDLTSNSAIMTVDKDDLITSIKKYKLYGTESQTWATIPASIVKNDDSFCIIRIIDNKHFRIEVNQ